jgi:hypothetical protein
MVDTASSASPHGSPLSQVSTLWLSMIDAVESSYIHHGADVCCLVRYNRGVAVRS